MEQCTYGVLTRAQLFSGACNEVIMPWYLWMSVFALSTVALFVTCLFYSVPICGICALVSFSYEPSTLLVFHLISTK